MSKFFALSTAVPFESKEILVSIKGAKYVKNGGKDFYIGELCGKNVILINSGIGKTNAAHSATMLLEKYEIKSLILFGIGGAYEPSGLLPGDIAIATSETYGDEGVMTHNGWHPTELIGFPLVRKNGKDYYNYFPMDSSLLDEVKQILASLGFTRSIGNTFQRIKKICSDMQDIARIIFGPFITVSTCSGSKNTARMMYSRFHGICENMEGAAVAHVCALYEVPIIEIRGISNMVGDRNRWKKDEASWKCQRMVSELVRRIDP